jgi:cell division protein FtsB
MSTMGESHESVAKEVQGSATEPATTGVNDRAHDDATLDYKGKRLEYRTKVLGYLTAIFVFISTVLGIGVVVLGNRTGNQSEDIDSLRGRIDSLQRTNGDQAEQVRTLEEEVATLRTQRDDAVSERDTALAELDEANARLAEAGQEATTSSLPTSNAEDGGQVRSFTLALSRTYNGTALDLDAGSVGQSGSDLRYKNKNGQRALIADHGNAVSLNIGVHDPNHAQCKEAVDRRPIAQDDSWGSPTVNQQACIASHYGISLLTVASIAENGDLGMTQVYWRTD